MSRICLCILALVALSQGRTHHTKQSFSPRIVNGEPAAPGEVPYQVSLQLRPTGFHFCGGSVINENYIITAGHCSDYPASRIRIVAGTTKLSKPQVIRNVVKIDRHEGFDPSKSWLHDIALMKVDEPFEFTEFLLPVPLPNPHQKIQADDKAVVTGWGRLRLSGNVPDNLQKVVIYIADQEYCGSVYGEMGYAVYDTHICAHDPTSEKGSCNGDSGGPLMVDGKLVGLVSWAYGCAHVNYPTVYTRVPEYVDWIAEHAV